MPLLARNQKGRPGLGGCLVCLWGAVKARCGALGMKFTRVTEFQHGRVFSVSKSSSFASRGANEPISRIAGVFLMQEAYGGCLFGLDYA